MILIMMNAFSFLDFLKSSMPSLFIVKTFRAKNRSGGGVELRQRAYVIRAQRFKETSLIIEWLSDREGRIDTLARGAFRKKSPFAGKLDLFFLADMSLRKSRRSELHLLKEVVLIAAPIKLQRSLVGLGAASYFVDLVKRTTEKNTPLPEIFNLFDQAIRAAETGFALGVLTLWFEWRLLLILGLQPSIQKTKISPIAFAILRHWEKPSAFASPLDPFPKSEIAKLLGTALKRECNHDSPLRMKILSQG